MHRQSLGSPASKLQSHGVLSEQPTTNNNSASSSSDGATDNEQRKTQKPNQQKSPHESPSSSKLVHIIPILTFFCFLILYLSSHDPSNTGQTQFSGFATLSSKKIETDDSVGGGSLAIRSVRKLEQGDRERRRFHRKLWQQS